MEILPGIEIKEKSLWVKKKKILIIADIHLGYEQKMIDSGILVPKRMFSEIKKEIEELLKLKPELIVINGDVKHELGKISDQEWRDALDFLDLLMNKAEVILIRGNHDNLLEPIARKRGIEVRNFYCFDDICVLHGHKIFLETMDKKIKTLIIGHDHPAITLDDGVKKEKFKCFLFGSYKDKKIIVMPSFFNLVEGSDIKKERLFSPFLKDLNNFRVFVLGDKVYDFGKLKNIR
ncbi:MAG: metallophosphoesterase [Candidatus Pacearchaeota archaeon]|nr:metallophosphoesterase [Candidatus Pacearchaeota archaeon]